ncbi:DUF948 domain-containing protein [Hazenella sp. IB182357]|uniref:DUF948 domain-containing protein n=1 Tax=Polycladospora coralii TaxID=2771432 RepID=A0A926NAE3_9BACL|nr:DUF948 domain-containing protein [Polycladospora coralii]
MILQISIAIAAVTFVVLVMVIIRTLRQVKGILEKIDRTVTDVKPQINDVLGETKESVGEANMLLADMREKSHKTDALFNAVNHVGKGLEELSSTLTNKSNQVTTSQSNQPNIKIGTRD